LTPGPWCSHGRRRDFSHHCRVTATGPVLRYRFHPPGVLDNEAYGGSRSFTLSGLLLACGLWMDHRPLGFLPGFTPRRYQRRMPGAETSAEHSPGANRRSFSTLHFGYLTHTVRPHVAPPRSSGHTQPAGPGRASPVPAATIRTFRAPYAGESFGACASRSSAPSLAFALHRRARHSLVPAHRTGHLTTRQASLHVTDRSVARPQD